MPNNAADRLNSHQQQELERRLRGRASSLTIPRAEPTRSVPLSFEQESIWLHNELRGNSAVYNRTCIFRLSGDLNRRALECSLEAIVARHAVLRSRISNHSGSLVQME